MFEKSLLVFEDGRDRLRKRLIAGVSVGLQAGLIALFVVVPLMDPARMPVVSAATLKTVSLTKPKLKLEPPKHEVVRVTEAAATRAPSSSAAAVVKASGAIISRSPVASPDEPPLLPIGGGMVKGGPLMSSLGSGPASGTGPVMTIRPNPGNGGGVVRLSSGVTSGMLLAPIRPNYPQIARVSRTEGTVVVTATIDKNGRIVGLQVVSGPVMLRQAAADAIREARYRPYLLNGSATEVETTISVSFKMGI
jgi:periplasmic protein TonB